MMSRPAAGARRRRAFLVSGVLAVVLAPLTLPMPASADEAAGSAATGLPQDARPRPQTRIAARLDADSGAVTGEVTVRFRNVTAAPLERAYIWLLPNRLSQPAAALDDVNHYWIYPRRFNPGSMRITAVRASGSGVERVLAANAWRPEAHAVAGREVLWSIALPEPIEPGRELRLVLEFGGRIPERYGSLGCVAGQCTLMGGFYPMLAALDAAGWNLESAPMRTDMDVQIELVRPAAVMLLGQSIGQDVRRPADAQRNAATAASGANDENSRIAALAAPVTRIRARLDDAPYASLLVAPRLFESQRQVGAVLLRYLATSPPPPTEEAHDQILPYTQESYARLVLDSAAQAAELLTAVATSAGQPLGPIVVTMVEAPLRFELAEPHPGMVLVSDHIFRIWPATRFRKLHERQLMRAVFGGVWAERLAREPDRPDAALALDQSATADAIASYLTDLFVLGQYKKSEFVSDILAPVAFVPVVDQLLYAPQTMFAGAYFGGVLDDEPLRDHPERFMHQRPRGRLYYEKLRDLIGTEALTRAMRAVIADRVSFERAAEDAHGKPLGWFFRQWSRPYPRLDYRLADVVSKRLQGGGYLHTITVERRVAPGEVAPIEPVTVAVDLASGERTLLTWDGSGSQGTLRLRTNAAIARVTIDPRGRLVERALPGDSDHPLYNNRDPARLRFVYNGFGALLNVTDLSALLAADFTLSRVHDLKNRLRLSLFTSASATVGASVGYTRSFGPAITPDRLLGATSIRLSAQRLRSGFFGDDDDRAATRLTLSLGLGQSDRLFVFEPRFVRDIDISGSVSVTRRDAADIDMGAMGPDGDGVLPAEYLVSGSLYAGMVRLHTLGGSHTLGAELAAAMSFGDIATRSQLVGAGGPSALRGYAPGALFTRLGLLARLEYRHVFVHDLAWNLGHYQHVRGLGGALFADLGLLSPCESYDLTAPGSVQASVGYGLQFFYDSFGTLPQMMRIDVAVPLSTGSRRECLGAPLGESPPVMVYLGFLPPF